MIGRHGLCVALAATTAFSLACGGTDRGGGVTGVIETDGSSTVFPITEAMAEEFGIATGGSVNVNVGYSGTGGGFKRFCAGETDISNASRPISDEERELCRGSGVEFLEIPIAIDGLAVVVNPANSFAECLTVQELKNIWGPGSTVRRWSQVRPEFPDEDLKLYGPGTNSGTFDYFTEVIGGDVGASRGDYTASEDDNVLVTGVEGDRTALGYFGYAYYVENQERVKLVGVDSGDGCVRPDPVTVKSGRYAPLSRPLFIYVRRSSLDRPAVAEFVRFYLDNADELVSEVGYVPLEAAEYATSMRSLERDASGR